MDGCVCILPAPSGSAHLFLAAAVTLVSLAATCAVLYGRACKGRSQDDRLSQGLCHLLREVLDTLTDGYVLLHTENGSIVGANAQAQELLGVEGMVRDQLPLSGLCKLRVQTAAGRRYEVEACTLPRPVSRDVISALCGDSIVLSNGGSVNLCTVRITMDLNQNETSESDLTESDHRLMERPLSAVSSPALSGSTPTPVKADAEYPSRKPSKLGPAPSVVTSSEDDAQGEPSAVAPVVGSPWQSMQVVALGVGGEYERVRIVAGGSQGTVWQVKSQDGKIFAQKDIPLKGHLWQRDFPLRLRNADREVRALKKLSWASCVIVRVVDCWIKANFESATIVMEWLPWSLRQVFDARRAKDKETLPADLLQKLPVELMQKWVAQLAAGVAAIHSVDFIHRDLKPSNILLDESLQHCKITDLGVSRALRQTGESTKDGRSGSTGANGSGSAGANGSRAIDAVSSVTSVGSHNGSSDISRQASEYSVRPGTIDYTSPEALKSGNYGPPMDIFALGGVLFELLTLEMPPMIPLGVVESTLPMRATELLRPHVAPPTAAVDGESLPDDRKRLNELEELCISMVSALPGNRPTAKDIVAMPGILQHAMPLAAQSEEFRCALGISRARRRSRTRE